MIVIIAFSTTVLLTYCCLALWWLRALKAHVHKHHHHRQEMRLSILIPFRNEAKHIRKTLSYLKSQSYPKELLQIIFIDDHSTDNGPQILRDCLGQDDFNVRLLSNAPGAFGKKAAIATGLAEATGEIILQTDADCKPKAEWAESLSLPLRQGDCIMSLGPVRMKSSGGFWSRFAALEYMSLQAVGAAMAKADNPIMGSAANMAYAKSALKEDAGAKRASGDDVFLIQQLGKGKRVNFTLNPASIVDTRAPNGFGMLVQQRARWGGKTFSYPSGAAKAVAFLVALTAVLQVALFVLGFYLPWVFYVFVGMWLLKALADYPLLKYFASKTGQRKLLRYFVPASLVYPLYICVTGISILLRPVRWKERRMRPLID